MPSKSSIDDFKSAFCFDKNSNLVLIRSNSLIAPIFTSPKSLMDFLKEVTLPRDDSMSSGTSYCILARS